ncbi:hypothetical protein [Niallia sp.]|uniref:hypothetical protein n=1 Tax=Niallia sp. TaxID=2837523 RepID=UPI00289E8A71|nr:hypothetical protein [Niallia sp.]
MLLNLVIEKKNQHTDKKTKSRRKTSVIIVTLLILLAGGSINQETLGKTRVSLGPDVYKYYKEGGVFQLDKEIQEKGFLDIYAYPEDATNTLIVQFYTPESLDNKKEVTELIEAYLKERDLHYEIKYEVINQVVEVEQTEEQKAAKRVIEMQQEIFQLVSGSPYYYMQNFISEESGESTEILLSDSISEEEEQNLKNEIKNIINKYDLEWDFSIGKVEADVVEMEKAIWNIYPALAEAYIYSENNYNVYDMYPTYVDGVLEFNVYTELSLSTDEQVAKKEELIKELKRSLRIFLQHEDIQNLLNQVPYIIKVYGKDGNEIHLET